MFSPDFGKQAVFALIYSLQLRQLYFKCMSLVCDTMTAYDFLHKLQLKNMQANAANMGTWANQEAEIPSP